MVFYFRFERGPSFRVREERRPEGEHRNKVDVRHSRDRYPEANKGALFFLSFLNRFSFLYPYFLSVRSFKNSVFSESYVLVLFT